MLVDSYAESLFYPTDIDCHILSLRLSRSAKARGTIATGMTHDSCQIKYRPCIA
jgi:hypothetical protein